MAPKGGYAPLGGEDGTDVGGSNLEMTAASTSERAALLNSLSVVRGNEAVELERVSAPLFSPPGQSSSSAGRAKPAHDDVSDAESGDSDSDAFPPRPSPAVHLATKAQKRSLWWRNVLITGMFILSWYAFATILSMYNKWMFSPEHYDFVYPLFVTACHMAVQFICASTIRYTLKERFRPAERPTRREYATRICPTSAATSADIGLSNLSLKTITLSLYTMCKSSALIFVLMFAFLFKLERFSYRLLSVICLISLGVFMMVFHTSDASIPGIVMVICASAIGGLRWALTELIMHKRAMGLSNPFATIFWLSPIMCVMLLIVSAIFEDWHKMFSQDWFFTTNVPTTIRSIGVIALPGVVAFAMVASEFFVIQRAGVVPLSIAGIAKEVSTLAFSAWVFGDKLTLLNIIGCVVTVSGIALYAFHKYQKRMQEDVRLDAAENPILDEDDETAPLAGRHRRNRSRALSTASSRSIARSVRSTRSGRSVRSSHSHQSHPSMESPNTVGVPLQDLEADGAARGGSRRRSNSVQDAHEERVARLRDEFEGWDTVNVDSEGEAESDVDDDEVAHRRELKVGGMRNRWDRFWDASM